VKSAYILSAVLLICIILGLAERCAWGKAQTDLVVLVAASVVLLHTHDKVEDGDECADCVGVSPEHDVAESDVVVGGNMGGSHAGERGLWQVSAGFHCYRIYSHLLVELDVVHDLQRKGEVS
jgi:hypothetical protein